MDVIMTWAVHVVKTMTLWIINVAMTTNHKITCGVAASLNRYTCLVVYVYVRASILIWLRETGR